MSAAKSTPGPGLEISLRIGQRVRHADFQGRRVTGVVRGITDDCERGLMVDCALDAPIVIPPCHGFDETRIYRQYAPAHEFSPFDEREELIVELVEALRESIDREYNPFDPDNQSARYKRLNVLLAKATGSAALAKAGSDGVNSSRGGER